MNFQELGLLFKLWVFLWKWDPEESLSVQLTSSEQDRPLWRNVFSVLRGVVFPRIRTLTVDRLRQIGSDIRQLEASSLGEIAVVWETLNQMRALREVAIALKKRSVAVALTRSSVSDGHSLKDVVIPLANFAGLLMLPFGGFVYLLTFQKLFLMKRLGRQKLLVFRSLFLIFPLVLAWVVVLSRSRPAAVLMANDHTETFLALMLASRFLGIKTAYMQHAHVTARFPPLTVDMAFLDGECAARVYRGGLGPTSVFLTGSPRLRASASEPPKGIVGIGLSLGDDPAHAFEIARSLEAQGCTVKLRLHPRHPKAAHEDLDKFVSSSAKLLISKASEEPPKCFLESISILLASNSSIHLEGALANRKTFYVNLGSPTHDEEKDYYGFVDGGLTEIERDIVKIASVAQDPPRLAVDSERLEFYCVQTGDPAVKICSILNHYLDGGSIVPPGWEMFEGLGYRKAALR